MKELKINEEIELTPQESQEYSKIGYVLLWLDRKEYKKQLKLPKIRRYKCLVQNLKSLKRK